MISEECETRSRTKLVNTECAAISAMPTWKGADDGTAHGIDRCQLVLRQLGARRKTMADDGVPQPIVDRRPARCRLVVAIFFPEYCQHAFNARARLGPFCPPNRQQPIQSNSA